MNSRAGIRRNFGGRDTRTRIGDEAWLSEGAEPFYWEAGGDRVG